MRLKAAWLGRAGTVGVFAIVAALLVFAQSPSRASATVIVTNGSFETTGMAGWTVDAPVDQVCGWDAADGNCLVDMGATPSQGQIHQDLPTVAGHAYTLTFQLAGNPQCNATDTSKTLYVTASGNPTQTYTFDTTGHSTTSMGWVPAIYSFTATAASTTLTLENGSVQTCGAAIDALSIVDNDLSIATNPDITTPQTSVAGAVVTYPLPAVTNGVPVTPVCAPASGSTFPVGTTQVQCTATDPGDLNSPASSTFKVNVTALPTQTVSILGGSGTTGQVDPSTDWSWDVAQADPGYSFDGTPHPWHLTGNPNPVWYPAYLAGSHPWGFVPGTNNWLNCGPNVSSSCRRGASSRRGTSAAW